MCQSIPDYFQFLFAELAMGTSSGVKVCLCRLKASSFEAPTYVQSGVLSFNLVVKAFGELISLKVILCCQWDCMEKGEFVSFVSDLTLTRTI